MSYCTKHNIELDTAGSCWKCEGDRRMNTKQGMQWIGDKVYFVDDEVADYIESLEQRITKLRETLKYIQEWLDKRRREPNWMQSAEEYLYDLQLYAEQALKEEEDK